jgi:ABC-type antimicrobial peptide transport system permease subunit
LILFETGIQVVVAVAVGVTLAIPANHYLVNTGLDLSALGNITLMGMAWDPIWRSHVELSTYTGPTVTLIIIVIFAVSYPAIRAATIRPLDAMRES